MTKEHIQIHTGPARVYAAALLPALINLWLHWDAPAAAVIPSGLVLSISIAIQLAITDRCSDGRACQPKASVITQNL